PLPCDSTWLFLFWPNPSLSDPPQPTETARRPKASDARDAMDLGDMSRRQASPVPPGPTWCEDFGSAWIHLEIPSRSRAGDGRVTYLVRADRTISTSVG